MTRMVAHSLDHVGEFIGRKTGEYFRGAVRLELFENRSAPPHKWIVKQFDNPRDGKHRYYGRGLCQGELIDQVGQIRGRKITEDMTYAHTALIEPCMNPFKELL